MKKEMKNKIINTLRMMGVSGMNAVFFADALDCYHLTISQKVKKHYRDIMLNTVIFGKALRQWFIDDIEWAESRGLTYEESGMSVPVKLKNYDIERIESDNIRNMLHRILQEYYKKIKILES